MKIKNKTLSELKQEGMNNNKLKVNEIIQGKSILRTVLIEILREKNLKKNIEINSSPKGKVQYLDFDDKVHKSLDGIVGDLNQIFGVYSDTGSGRKASRVVRLGNKKTGAAKDVVNFRVIKKSSGVKTPTSIQERGSSFIIDQVLRRNKRYHSKQSILEDEETYKTLKRIFYNYEDNMLDWVYTYYEQQRNFLLKFEDVNWGPFIYGNKSFVNFFMDNIKDKHIYLSYDPLKKLQKYEQWNPADIYAAYKMRDIKKELDRLFQGETNDPDLKGVHLARLNKYLIKLFDEKKLIGISLKKINEPDKAEIVLRNIDDESYLDPKVETKKYTMSDINFDIENGISNEKKQTVSTYIKFGDGYSIDIKGSSSKFNNLAFGTSIKAKSAAQGGNAPIELVVSLMRKTGTNVSFRNDHGQYPKNIEQFFDPPSTMYSVEDYEKWFKLLVEKKYFKTYKSYDSFELYISDLYESNKGAIAQSKLMQLHFYYDSFKSNSDNVKFWLKILYLGMKVGKRFAPHSKIY